MKLEILWWSFTNENSKGLAFIDRPYQIDTIDDFVWES